MGVSKNRSTPKLSILIGFSIINHPFWGTIIFGNTHMIDEKNTHQKSHSILPWIHPPPRMLARHQDDMTSLLRNPYKPLYATVTGWGAGSKLYWLVNRDSP